MNKVKLPNTSISVMHAYISAASIMLCILLYLYLHS